MNFKDRIRILTKKMEPIELFGKILEEYQEKIGGLIKLKTELKSLNPNGFKDKFYSMVLKLGGPGELEKLAREVASLIKEIEEQRKREKEEIEGLFSEINSLIEKALPSIKNPEILAGLKILGTELFNVHQEFNIDRISYQEAKKAILDMQEQAKILIIPTSEEEARLRETYYEILGISPEADQEEIRNAYRKIIQEYHPDSQPPNSKEWVKKQSEEMTKRINEAHQVLGDPAKRREYDRKIGIRR